MLQSPRLLLWGLLINVDISRKSNLKPKLNVFALNYDLHLIITRFTETTIDLIFVNHDHRIVQVGILMGDYNSVFCVIKG